MRFTSTLLSNGKTATGVQVPEEVVSSLGTGKRPKVRVTIGEHTYRSSVAPMGGVYMLGVSAEVRAAAGIKPGDEVELDIELDTEPREVEVPPDLAEALSQNPAAAGYFAGLSYSNRRRLVLAVEEAKAAETRRRRIDKTVTGLAEGRS